MKGCVRGGTLVTSIGTKGARRQCQHIKRHMCQCLVVEFNSSVSKLFFFTRKRSMVSTERFIGPTCHLRQEFQGFIRQEQILKVHLAEK